MKKELGTFAAAIGLAAAVVTGIAAYDSPRMAGFADELASPIACVDPTCGTPVAATPEPTATVVPTAEPTTAIDTIEELPGTGTGSTAGR